MTKNVKNVTRSYLDKLKEENEQLKKDNQVLGNELTYFKELSADYEEEINNLKNRCRSLNKRNMQLESEVADMRFTRKYLTSEEAGARFAQELLGGA